MKNELWLEFGFLHRDQNNFEDMCWYNEGRAREMWYFLKNLWTLRNKKDVYFKMRYAKKTIYLRGKTILKGEE